MVINKQRVVELLAQATEGREDQVEREGLYYAGGPCCLVGNALSLAGVPDDVLTKLDDLTFSQINYFGVLDILGDAGFEFTNSAVIVMTAAQDKQDGGGTWGSALLVAKDMARRFDDKYEEG